MAKAEQRHRQATLSLTNDRPERWEEWLADSVGSPIGWFAEVDLSSVAELLAAAEQRGASTRALELEQLRAAVNEAVTELGKWQQRTHTGSVCWPQPMHDGTIRVYAAAVGKTPMVAQGRDFLVVVRGLCAQLGIALKLAHPELPDEPKETT